MTVIPYTRLYRTQDASRHELIQTMHELGRRHFKGACRHDEMGTLHHALLDDLRMSGYLGAAVPRKHGGGGHRLVDLVMAQAALAEYDPSTALGIGMHHMVVGDEAESASWPLWQRRAVFRGVVAGERLLNVLATEPGVGSPQGNAMPQTVLRQRPEGGWLLSGTKSFATFASVLTHAVVFCALEDGSDHVARVLVPMDSPGIAIEPTWDSVGMRATESHHVHFTNVPLAESAILATQPFGVRSRRPAMTPWFTLLVSAVYLGIARAAHAEGREHALRTIPGRTEARTYDTRRAVAECERRLLVAESVLLSAAATVDAGQRDAVGLTPLEVTAKLEVTSMALDVVDSAVRIVGGASLQRGSRLERAWRDVRCGTIHPPTDATALSILEQSALRTAAASDALFANPR